MKEFLFNYWIYLTVISVVVFIVLAFVTEVKVDANINNGIHPLKGIAGWCYILAISAVLEPFRHVYIIVFNLYEMNGNNVFVTLPTLFDQHKSILIFLIVFKILGPALLFGAYCYVSYLFFTMKKLFIVFSVFLTWSYTLYWIIGIITRSLMHPQIHIFESAHIYSVIGGILSVLVWVKYLKQSERVKINFIQ